MFENLQITDADINEIEPLFGDIKFDTERRDILKDLTTVDIQALPGTGKTTLLVARLALLAKKWAYSNKGICVLSHTNVAREEIERRLGNKEIGRKLLSYPHFIGTIHSFFDNYVSLPWLESKGKPVQVIDTDIVTKIRYSQLDRNLLVYLKKQYFEQKNLQTSTFPKITINLNCSEHTSSYKTIQSIIQSTIDDGYYTFEEMLLVAEHVLGQYSNFSAIVQARFPVLFIDEAQDTTSLQEKLLQQCFASLNAGFCQRFGDSNQAIFLDNDSNDKIDEISFPKTGYKILHNSKRFDASIAKLASPYTSDSLLGDSLRFMDKDHTVFIFNEHSISKVLDEYAKLILESFSDDELNNYKNYGCHVVGMVHKLPEENDAQFPRTMCHYYTAYNPDCDIKRPKLSNLIDYFYFGEQESSDDLYFKTERVSKGLLIYLYNTNKQKARNIKSSFRYLLALVPSEKQLEFRKQFLNLVTMPYENKTDWQSLLLSLKDISKIFLDVEININDVFFIWKDNFKQTDKKRQSNVYTYKDVVSGRSVDLSLSSIHAVKGCTHLSTLVVETFWYDFNIQNLIKELTKKKPDFTKTRIKQRCKCQFVALTRAMGLVCMAIPDTSITSKQEEFLKNQGWNITHI